MTTCRDVVTLALQMARVVAIGRDPKAAEADYGMTTLQSVYDNLFASGAFGTLKGVYAADDYDADEGDKVTAETGVVVSLPDTVEADDGTSRAPYDLTAICVVQDGLVTNSVWWDGAWQTCSNLTLDDDAPLASMDLTGLGALVARDLAETYGTSLTQGQMVASNRFRMALFYKLGSDRGRAANEYF